MVRIIGSREIYEKMIENLMEEEAKNIRIENDEIIIGSLGDYSIDATSLSTPQDILRVAYHLCGKQQTDKLDIKLFIQAASTICNIEL